MTGLASDITLLALWCTTKSGQGFLVSLSLTSKVSVREKKINDLFVGGKLAKQISFLLTIHKTRNCYYKSYKPKKETQLLIQRVI